MYQLPKELEEQLKDIRISFDQIEPRERYTSAIQLIEEAIVKLTAFLRVHKFETEVEEITFFKDIRPSIFAFQIEEGLKYNLTINKPIGTTHLQVKYFEDGLKGLQSFFRLNGFYYQYYKNQFKELDMLYFKRNAGSLAVPLSEIAAFDNEFSTPVSDVFAKFIAYERVQNFIINEIDKLTNGSARPINNTERTNLKWTGETVNLVELVYGIWLTGQMNHGNASLNQIVRWFEASLGVSIGVVQRKFTEIERRKRISVTKFLDHMKKAIAQKIESDNY